MLSPLGILGEWFSLRWLREESGDAFGFLVLVILLEENWLGMFGVFVGIVFSVLPVIILFSGGTLGGGDIFFTILGPLLMFFIFL